MRFLLLYEQLDYWFEIYEHKRCGYIERFFFFLVPWNIAQVHPFSVYTSRDMMSLLVLNQSNTDTDTDTGTLP